MNQLQSYNVIVSNFNLDPLGNSLSDNKSMHWKIGLPAGVQGNCTGKIIVAAVPSS